MPPTVSTPSIGRCVITMFLRPSSGAPIDSNVRRPITTVEPNVIDRKRLISSSIPNSNRPSSPNPHRRSTQAIKRSRKSSGLPCVRMIPPDPRGASVDSITSRNGTWTKARSFIKGCGAVNRSVESVTPSIERMSRSSVRAPQCSVRTRPSAASIDCNRSNNFVGSSDVSSSATALMYGGWSTTPQGSVS